MTIDERIEKLTERHEALTLTVMVELLLGWLNRATETPSWERSSARLRESPQAALK